MSGESNPIPASLFAEAIKELPLSTLYAKVSELRNSMAHLRRSNDELRAFVTESCESEDDKRELEGYIAENDGVMKSMTERITLLKAEVEGRGQQWIEVEENDNKTGDANAGSEGDQASSNFNGAGQEGSGDTNGDDGQDGVYL